ncbi:Uncharacterized protein APZ42_013531 [Daphnia magna]|uniref:DUF4806 domain-containing protein n=1 Tax=Daphnia magna TaxID=35525 RepID=A0A162QSE2_9CRUS|nr:Uncharacterized protein APZ42_013531 [Daphnia magna]
MTTFLIVKFTDESKENEVVPSTWFYGGKCSLPSKNHRQLAKAGPILKMSWKRHDCKIVSSHGKLRYLKSLIMLSGICQESDDIAISQDMFQPAGTDSAESESGMDEESGVTAAINAGLLTQPAARTVCGPMTESSQMTSYGDRSTSQPEQAAPKKQMPLSLHQKRLSFERQVLRHFSNQNCYLRVMAREIADIKAEQRDLRRLWLSKQSSGSIDRNNGEYRHPVFQKHVSLPLKTKEDFHHFEEELLKPDVERLRSFFEKHVEDTVRRIWREVMSNELMQAYTWSGTPKPNSGKEKGLAVKGSRLLYAVTEAVKHGEFGNTSIPRIEQISIRKAVDRLKNSSQKK